ncbi:MAG: SixA phosphatase family protein [Actinomycetales bacterium]
MTSGDPSHRSGPVRLLLMRHAKAAYPDNCSDHERPLAGRGRKDAAAAGAWLDSAGWVPDLIVCSDAARTVETAELVASGLGADVPITPHPDLYEAGVGDVLKVVAETPKKVRTLLVVGHEPTMSATAGTVSGKFAHFPTSTVAQVELEGGFADIEPDSGRLVSVHTPKD